MTDKKATRLSPSSPDLLNIYYTSDPFHSRVYSLCRALIVFCFNVDRLLHSRYNVINRKYYNKLIIVRDCYEEVNIINTVFNYCR